MLIDLHTHSTESDGTLTPEEVVEFASSKGFVKLALTDHDTTSGLERFTTQAEKSGISAAPGIEISAEWKSGHCHLIGLNLSDRRESLETTLETIREGRILRNQEIMRKLNKLGIPLQLGDVEKFAGGNVIARPHIAMALYKGGYAESLTEAFERFLKKGACAYVERFRLQPESAVRLLKEAGARVVLAHPSQLNLQNSELKSFMEKLMDYGLDGMEVFTPYVDDNQIGSYLEIVRELGLKCSGGSDFHGENKPERHLGYYRPDVPVPKLALEILN